MSKKEGTPPSPASGDAEPVPVAFLATEIKTPPFSATARMQAGWLLWRLQQGESIPMPHNRPMPSLGPRVGELRIADGDLTWRILYRRDDDALLVVEIFAKKDRKTPQEHKDRAVERLRRYDQVKRVADKKQ